MPRVRAQPVRPVLLTAADPARRLRTGGPAGARTCGRRCASLVPTLQVAARRIDDNEDLQKRWMFEAVRETLLRFSAKHAAVLVLEDLHWADAGSLDLLRFIAPALVDTRICLVGTIVAKMSTAATRCMPPSATSSGHARRCASTCRRSTTPRRSR